MLDKEADYKEKLRAVLSIIPDEVKDFDGFKPLIDLFNDSIDNLEKIKPEDLIDKLT